MLFFQDPNKVLTCTQKAPKWLISPTGRVNPREPGSRTLSAGGQARVARQELGIFIKYLLLWEVTKKRPGRGLTLEKLSMAGDECGPTGVGAGSRSFSCGTG